MTLLARIVGSVIISTLALIGLIQVGGQVRQWKLSYDKQSSR